MCFRSRKEGEEDWSIMHQFFTGLPQIAAVLAKYQVQLEIRVPQGDHICINWSSGASFPQATGSRSLRTNVKHLQEDACSFLIWILIRMTEVS